MSETSSAVPMTARNLVEGHRFISAPFGWLKRRYNEHYCRSAAECHRRSKVFPGLGLALLLAAPMRGRNSISRNPDDRSLNRTERFPAPEAARSIHQCDQKVNGWDAIRNIGIT